MPDYTPPKRCAKCGNEYPASSEYFHRARNRPDGLYNYCKKCACSSVAQWSKDHPLETKNSHKHYLETHTEYNRKYKRDYARKHSKENYQKNKAVYKKRRKAQYARERENAKYKALEWYRNNKDRAIATAKVNTQRRNARKHSLPDTFTPAEWEHCLAYFHDCCAVCGRPQGLWHTLAMDHWIPLTSSACPGTVVTNIVPLCHGEGGCNNSKGGRDPLEWLVEHRGKRKAGQIERRINEYFASLKHYEL